MSIHTPPSTYILRDFADVEPMLQISFVPQTIAWKVIAMLLLVGIAYGLFGVLRNIYENRYRSQAIKAVDLIPLSSSHFSQDLFKVMKSVFVYLSAQHAQAFGDSFFEVFELYQSEQKTLSPAMQHSWTHSLVSLNSPLDMEQKLLLKHYCLDWIKQHQPRPNNDV